MSRLATYFLIAVATVLGGCANLVPLSRVDAAEARWRSRGVQDYRYSLEVSSLSPYTPCSPGRIIEVEVRGGKTVKFGTCAPDAELAGYFGSIPKIFATIRSNRRDRPPRYLVRFNSKLGYPESIDANYSRTMTDYVVRYYVQDLAPIP